ncbi:hypothetical protein J7E43_08270 [Bacillus sp. ISL-8]|nr:hypothetical protein [Bacillus sp. ISL-8]
MNKKLFKFLICTILLMGLSACGSTSTQTESSKTNSNELKQADKKQNKGPSQEELNDKLKSEAEDAVFVKANGDQYKKGQKLKITGTVGLLLKSMAFPALSVSTNEGSGEGLYTIQIVQSGIQVSDDKFTLKDNINISKNDKITVFGVFDGKDTSGIPQITATIIEKNN